MNAAAEKAVSLFLTGVRRCLADAPVTAFLYGSAALDDFRPGWSDIDLLILTGRDLTAAEADSLVHLRQTLMALHPNAPYLRAIEGAALPLDALLSGRETPVAYWGTGGQRVKARFALSAIDFWQLRHHSILLTGEDCRSLLPDPTRDELTGAVRAHLAAIRQHGCGSEDIYAFGWLIDVARGLYTVRTGRVAAKTAAGQWALEQHLCPDEDALTLALQVRRNPALMDDAQIRQAAANLGSAIQRFADVLANEV